MLSSYDLTYFTFLKKKVFFLSLFLLPVSRTINRYGALMFGIFYVDQHASMCIRVQRMRLFKVHKMHVISKILTYILILYEFYKNHILQLFMR